MVRTQIYLTDDEHRELKSLSGQLGKKQSELIRQAVDGYLASRLPAKRLDLLSRGRGLWKDRSDLPDFTTLRQSWSR
jgi:hypothetical protein